MCSAAEVRTKSRRCINTSSNVSLYLKRTNKKTTNNFKLLLFYFIFMIFWMRASSTQPLVQAFIVIPSDLLTSHAMVM